MFISYTQVLCILLLWSNTTSMHTKCKFKANHHCNAKSKFNGLDTFYQKSVFESSFFLIFIIFLSILFLLLLLGTIKGLLGIYVCKKIGEFGMGMLVDLPRPLDQYQERELKYKTVRYDVGGWPVHPETGERTVRILNKKTELCLNVVFFLAYPLSILLNLCSLCCCIQNYHGEDDACFKEVNVIMIDGARASKPASKPTIDMYRENDTREEEDTKYVINMMKQSQVSLQKDLNKS